MSKDSSYKLDQEETLNALRSTEEKWKDIKDSTEKVIFSEQILKLYTQAYSEGGDIGKIAKLRLIEIYINGLFNTKAPHDTKDTKIPKSSKDIDFLKIFKLLKITPPDDFAKSLDYTKIHLGINKHPQRAAVVKEIYDEYYKLYFDIIKNCNYDTPPIIRWGELNNISLSNSLERQLLKEVFAYHYEIPYEDRNRNAKWQNKADHIYSHYPFEQYNINAISNILKVIEKLISDRKFTKEKNVYTNVINYFQDSCKEDIFEINVLRLLLHDKENAPRILDEEDPKEIVKKEKTSFSEEEKKYFLEINESPNKNKKTNEKIELFEKYIKTPTNPYKDDFAEKLLEEPISILNKTSKTQLTNNSDEKDIPPKY